MNRRTFLLAKIFSLVVLIIVLLLIALSKGFIFGGIKPLEEPIVYTFNDVEEINIHVTSNPITIVEADVDEIIVTTTVNYEGIGFRINDEISSQNGTLSIDGANTIGIWSSNGEWLIEIPKGQTVDIDVHTVSDTIYIDAPIDHLALDLVSADAKVMQAAKTIDINNVSSDVKLIANDQTESISIDTVSGDTEIELHGLISVEVDESTISGDVENEYHYNSSTNLIEVEFDSVSGDLSFENWQ